MTNAFKDMVYLFGAGATGNEYAPEHTINVEDVYRLANQHGVWETVYLCLSKINDISEYESNVLYRAAINMSRKQFIYKEIDMLENSGVECCYLKGAAVARFYKEPDCRISGDTDILVDEINMSKAAGLLENDGFEVEKNIGIMYHFEARHPEGGLLEVHRALYQTSFQDMLFKNMITYKEAYQRVEIDGCKVNILGVNDGLNHLTTHFIKHFIDKGAGIRQVMDLLLYMKYYENDIDWDKYNRTWKEIGFYGLIEKLKGIGVVYWKLDFDTYDTRGIDAILDDMEQSGAFGFGYQKELREKFMSVFLAERDNKSIKDVNDYIRKKHSGSILNRIFLNKEKMVKAGYQYASKGGIYLWFAYLVRIIDKIKGKSASHFEPQSNNYDSEISKRIELMRELELI